MRKGLFFVALVQFLYLVSRSQDSTLLNVSDKAPPLVLPSSKNTVESFTFPYQKKIVYLHFWASSVPGSKENFYRYKRLHRQYSDVFYKNGEGFEIILIALQEDRSEWENDIAKYNIESLKNFIALKGFKDYFVSKYNLKKIPTSMIINPAGYVEIIDPPIEALKSYIDENRSYIKNTEQSEKISGKITHGLAGKEGLGNEKVYITNSQSKDTLQSVITNNDGDFTIQNGNKAVDITLKLSNTEKVKSDESLFLKNDRGDIISDFNHTVYGYEYKLQPEDLNDLRDTKTNYQSPKKLVLSENLFKSGRNELTPASEKRLDILLEKLAENKNLNIQITTHTDCKGDKKYNNELSLKRANVIATYFVKKGVDKSRIITIGKGESEPLNNCIDGTKCTESELEENRRTEFILFEKKS